MGINIEKKVNEVLESRKHSNNITEIYTLLQKDDSSAVNYVQGLERIFSDFIERNEFTVDPNLKLTSSADLKVEEQYVKWLQEIYEKTLVKFLDLLDSNKKDVQEQVLQSLMKFLSVEGKCQMAKSREKTGSFPEQRLEQILKNLVSFKLRKTNLINAFGTYVEYKDVFYYTWKVLKKIVPSVQGSNDTFMLNVLDLLERIHLPKAKSKNEGEEKVIKTLCKQDDKKEFITHTGQIQKFMDKIWQNLVNRHVSLAVYRKLMVILLESYLPSLPKPLYLTDFFVASANLGGANTLLAMQGILTLVQKHNIEYPNIYGKLYKMFEPNIFHTKYKSRLFYLADIFLSSTHLPEKMVASFAKRVARLSLHAQIPDIIIGIRFIENLLLRHPGLKKMIHHSEGGEVADDPFIPGESDPMKTNAIESCLWEVSLLKHHIQPSVSSAAHFIDKNLPQLELDMADVLDKTNDEIFKSEGKKKLKPSFNISRPNKISKLADDRVYKMWALT